MPPSPLYFYPVKTIQTELEIKHSRFITTIGRVQSREEAAIFIDSVKKAHADAAHNCWAFIAGNPRDSANAGSGDDGEPQGTAGKPMLNVLFHKNIGEAAAVVTRYFGGIKLGTGGLVRAYSSSVQQAVDALTLKPYIEHVAAHLIIDYPDESSVRRLLETHNIALSEVNYAQHIRMTISVPQSAAKKLDRELADLTRGRARISWETV